MFPTCWGLPCRHQLRVYLQRNIICVPNEVISTSWMIKTEDQKRQSIINLLSIETIPSQNVPTLNQIERYALLTSEFKNVAHIASLSLDSTDELRTQVRKFLDIILKSKREGVHERYLVNQEHTVKNPKVPSSKGRPRQKRIRGATETHQYRKKHVKICRERAKVHTE